ncbi:hypothetical protein BJ322DRAFT_285988 [Thelephora terrestris]|uniref:DUF6533 domain-containing protein n=1 Tax=Thelephora terrestris TaxID=56493 RepID=A0A9P6H8N4_9AGAM|nr:hypothetical protein BJ322DRAFT_285988 [Thelephora terrestris]
MLSELGHLIQIGHDITAVRYYVMATGVILFYDYLLTLADEYVWPEKKSCAFWLFIFNRYFPMVYQFWQFAVTYAPHSRLDEEVSLVSLKFHRIPVDEGARCPLYSSGLDPQIPLDAYHLCVFGQHRTLEIAYIGISLLYDFLAFSLTVFFISRSKKGGHKLSIMLRTIVEDATRYFLFIFTSHIALAMILSFGRESIQYLSTSAAGNVVFLPVMVSRLMLSLRKAAHPQQNSPAPAGPRAGIRSLQSLRFFRPRRSTNPVEYDIPLDTYLSSHGSRAYTATV